MRTSRRPTVVAGFTLGLAALAMVTSGCSLASPTANSTYAASDGTNTQIGTVKLNNFLVVSEAKDKPGVVVGAVTTDGDQPVQVQLTVLGADGNTPVGEGTVTAQPLKIVKVGSGAGETNIQLSSVPVIPGANLTLRANIASGGTSVTLPVVAQTLQYKTITPSAPAVVEPPSVPSSVPSAPSTSAPAAGSTPTATATVNN